MDTIETGEDRQLSADELAVVAGGTKNSPQLAVHCASGKHFDEATITSGGSGGSTGGGITGSIQTWIHSYFGRS